MSTQVTYPEGFFLPKSAGTQYIDALTEVLNSPEFIKDDIEALEGEIADAKASLAEFEKEITERRKSLAIAYSLPANNRRVSDGPNVTGYEFVCLIIEPSCELRGATKFMVTWINDEGSMEGTFSRPTAQDAWQQAFKILDRRSGAVQ